MAKFEYKSVPAPKKGEKAKGVKGSDGRMAQAMTSLLNEMGADGWDYLRADTLPLEERTGLTSKSVHYYTVLVFRREIEDAAVVPHSDMSHDLEFSDADHDDTDVTVEAPVDDGEAIATVETPEAPRPSLTATRTP